MPEQRTDVTESSLLRTPIADEAGGGPISPAMAKANGSSLRLSGQIIDLVEPDRLPKPAMIPTPRAQDGYERRNMKTMERIANNGGDLTLPTWGATKGAALLPTPVASEGTKAPAQQNSETKRKTGQVWLSNVAKDLYELALLPTPNTMEHREIKSAGTDCSFKTEVSWWGQYEPAIRRWESVIGREAPAPTNPDGRDGRQRLSAEFTEWLMGVPAGWITGEEIGLKRNEMLKACGNGVVPQQATLALKLLLEGVDI